MRESAEQRDATVGSVDPLACTVREAARLLSVGTRKVEYMVKSGELESIKIGRARRIPRKALDAYLEKLRAAA
jgi:excisionase family DNA binding protein